ncbi:hypothetical protein INR49_027536 [Caranx melampygus]|nr:hypothetical protein INR49_027536 [Caranx melampygus]
MTAGQLTGSFILVSLQYLVTEDIGSTPMSVDSRVTVLLSFHLTASIPSSLVGNLRDPGFHGPVIFNRGELNNTHIDEDGQKVLMSVEVSAVSDGLCHLEPGDAPSPDVFLVAIMEGCASSPIVVFAGKDSTVLAPLTSIHPPSSHTSLLSNSAPPTTLQHQLLPSREPPNLLNATQQKTVSALLPFRLHLSPAELPQ